MLSDVVSGASGGDHRAPTRQELADLLPVRHLPGRNWTKADIVVYRHRGVELAIKDYAARPWWVRQTLGRLLVRREVRAYRAVCGTPGLARFRGRVDAFALAMDWIEATPLSGFSTGQVDPRCWNRLDERVRELHRRGVALVDLHHRDVLIDRGGEVWIVDLATAWVAGRRRGSLFERFCELDLLSVARMRARGLGRDPDQAVTELGGRAAAWHRRGRRIKRWRNRLRRRPRP